MRKLILYGLLGCTMVYGCTNKQKSKVYVPRPLKQAEELNIARVNPEDTLSVYEIASSKPGDKGVYGIRFGDTLVQINCGAKDREVLAKEFAAAEFLNTSKTSMIVQIADRSGLQAPFFILNLKGRQLEVISLYRASAGKQDSRFTKGMEAVGRTGYLINNDYFITPVIAKIYTIKRQHSDERIQGHHFINSPDKETLVFLTGNELYQVHYKSGVTFTEQIAKDYPKVPAQLYAYIQNRFRWAKDPGGIYFLKSAGNPDRVVDMSEFGSKK